MKPCARKEEGTAMRNYSGTPNALAVVGTQALVVRRLLRYVALVGVGWLAIAALSDVARPAAAAPVRRSGGVGVSTLVGPWLLCPARRAYFGSSSTSTRPVGSFI